MRKLKTLLQWLCSKRRARNRRAAGIEAFQLLLPHHVYGNCSTWPISTPHQEYEVLLLSGDARRMVDRILLEIDRQKDQAYRRSVMSAPAGGYQA